MTAQPIPFPSPDLIWHTMDDGLVVITPEDGKIRAFNDVASYIWTAVDGERSIVDIATLLSSKFEVSEEQALRDLDIFLTELEVLGLISWTEQSSS